jgi:hypothetical protein
MGIIGIALTDEKGREICRVDGDTHLLDLPLAELDTDAFHCITYIDQYGDTVFNRLQIPRLAIEWKAVDDKLKDFESREVSRQLQALIERAYLEPHQYLTFYGE